MNLGIHSDVRVRRLTSALALSCRGPLLRKENLMATRKSAATGNGATTVEEQGNGVRQYALSTESTGSEAVEEVAGEVSGVESTTEASAEAHAEVGTEATESGEEYAEASAEELAAAESEESAVGDLRSEGYEPAEAGEESAGAEALGVVPEAGAAIEGGGEEFFPLLAGLAAKFVPMLVSSVGPSIARAVQGRLSTRAKKVLAKPRAGGDIIAVLQKLLAQAMKQTEAAEEAVDEGLVEEFAQAMEVIIGTDDRVRINGTTKVPWRRYCALRIEFPSGAVYRGTGFFIGPRAVATAGHCVYLHNQGGWARRIEVIPGCNGTHRPFGSAFATTFRSTVGWTKDKLPAADYAAIILPAGAFPGQKFGSFGFGVFATNTLLATPVVLAGYPGDKPFAQLWGMRRKVKAATGLNLVYDIDSMGGQSGAPVYMKRNGKRYVVGIHNYGASTGNSATRVTQAVVANFKKWSTIGSTATTPVPTPGPAVAAPVPAMAGASGWSDADA
jgi:V8-like Glu-specific endopeptidase